MNCPNCKTDVYMSKPWPAPGRCRGCGWGFGGMPAGPFPAGIGGGGGAYSVFWYQPMRTDKVTVTGQIKVTADPTIPRDRAYMIQSCACGAGLISGVCSNLSHATPDQLDAVIDGMRLGWLIKVDENASREGRNMVSRRFTPAQRAAVSAHWSAQLRAKVLATSKPKLTVMVQVDCDE